ncbi:MAG TPA: alpha/beta hydrolase, partial [Acidimicrobiia bacterium]|nr:alpha/beta hydrolase [Acidimicrobiia bacterium]
MEGAGGPQDPEQSGTVPLADFRAAVVATEDRITAATGHPPTPRLARHVITLDDGHEVSVAVAGRGMPFVVVHGFMAEGFMYAQTLNRLVTMGYKVVAIDTAGHGGTDVLPEGELDFDSYVALLDRAVRQLGI